MAADTVPPETTTSTRRGFDLRALWRLTAWGSAAAVALAAAALASQTDNGNRRLTALVSADLPAPPVATAKIPPSDERRAEVERLEAKVRTLAADRDRLAERVAGLERHIEDITGSIKKQAAPVPAQTPITSAPPVIAPPAVTAAKPAEQPEPMKKAETRAAEQAPSPAVAPPAAAEPHEKVPLPPVRVATLPAAPTAKAEYGVALAGSSNLDVLHLQWTALKANLGPMLAGLRPSAAREQRGTVTHYRLVLGPLPNMAAAAKLCARLNAAHATCQAGKFTADPL